VISENARTVQAADAMKRGDAEELGELMNQSHESLRHDFEVSNPQLDTMVDISRELPGCLGARMTGAGFGGCAVALVRSDLAPGFVAAVTARYHERTGLNPAAYVCQAAEGASAVSPGA
jgi:galactokinase